MGENAPGHLNVHGFQHGGPVNRVGGEDIFADELAAGGPAAGESGIIPPVAHGGNIVDEGVKPDVADIIAVKGQFNSP